MGEKIFWPLHRRNTRLEGDLDLEKSVFSIFLQFFDLKPIKTTHIWNHRDKTVLMAPFLDRFEMVEKMMKNFLSINFLVYRPLSKSTILAKNWKFGVRYQIKKSKRSINLSCQALSFKKKKFKIQWRKHRIFQKWSI